MLKEKELEKVEEKIRIEQYDAYSQGLADAVELIYWDFVEAENERNQDYEIVKKKVEDLRSDLSASKFSWLEREIEAIHK